jgi:hypothetical protein
MGPLLAYPTKPIAFVAGVVVKRVKSCSVNLTEGLIVFEGGNACNSAIIYSYVF